MVYDEDPPPRIRWRPDLWKGAVESTAHALGPRWAWAARWVVGLLLTYVILQAVIFAVVMMISFANSRRASQISYTVETLHTLRSLREPLQNFADQYSGYPQTLTEMVGLGLMPQYLSQAERLGHRLTYQPRGAKEAYPGLKPVFSSFLITAVPKRQAEESRCMSMDETLVIRISRCKSSPQDVEFDFPRPRSPNRLP